MWKEGRCVEGRGWESDKKTRIRNEKEKKNSPFACLTLPTFETAEQRPTGR